MYSILYRKGVKIFKKHYQSITPEVSLADRVKGINQQIDTAPELEGIIF